MSAVENMAPILRRLRSGAIRLRSGWLPILQTALAACLAWFLAVFLLGLERPTFAPIAAVIILGLAVGERGRRAVELTLGVAGTMHRPTARPRGAEMRRKEALG